MSKIGGWESTGFGPHLKALREAAGLSQPELAVTAGCHKITLSKLEQGKQEPAWPLVLAISKALGVSVVAFEDAAPSTTPKRPVPKLRGRPRKANEERLQVVEEHADPTPQPGKRGKAKADVQAPAPSGEKDAPPASLPPPLQKPATRKPRKLRGG